MKGIVIDNPEWIIDEEKNKAIEKPRMIIVDENFNLWKVETKNPPAPLEEIEFEECEKISYGDLTSVAKANLPYAVEKTIEKNKELFLKFVNAAPQISIRMNSLELLPGIGKKTVRKILSNRPIEKLDKKLKEAIKKRIIFELEKGDKYTLFVGDNAYIKTLK